MTSAEMHEGAAVLALDVHRARLELAAAAARLAAFCADVSSTPAVVSRALMAVNAAAGRLAAADLLASR